MICRGYSDCWYCSEVGIDLKIVQIAHGRDALRVTVCDACMDRADADADAPAFAPAPESYWVGGPAGIREAERAPFDFASFVRAHAKGGAR